VVALPSSYEEEIYEMLSKEPLTPSEVAKRLGIDFRTAKDALMRLALTKKDVRYKAAGRIHIFWRERLEPGPSR
jgi:Mn-dependent DtxR family transcriptional regulator